MKYERLNQNITILNMHNHCFRSVKQLTNGEKTESQVIDEIVHDTAKILDKIEQGTLIELPCKVGDKIYFETWEDNGTTSIGVKGHKVAGFEINAIINGKYGKTYIPIKL